MQEKAAAYAEASVRLAAVHTKYFGEPLLKHARDFLPRDSAAAVFEDVTQAQTGGSSIAITREHFASGDIRTRYHLAAVGASWKIIGIDRECFLCRGTGRWETKRCQKCDGEGWYDPRKHAA